MRSDDTLCTIQWKAENLNEQRCQHKLFKINEKQSLNNTYESHVPVRFMMKWCFITEQANKYATTWHEEKMAFGAFNCPWTSQGIDPPPPLLPYASRVYGSPPTDFFLNQINPLQNPTHCFKDYFNIYLPSVPSLNKFSFSITFSDRSVVWIYDCGNTYFKTCIFCWDFLLNLK
jgi:hypothetical protein